MNEFHYVCLILHQRHLVSYETACEEGKEEEERGRRRRRRGERKERERGEEREGEGGGEGEDYTTNMQDMLVRWQRETQFNTRLELLFTLLYMVSNKEFLLLCN